LEEALDLSLDRLLNEYTSTWVRAS
jgi:hypothetical protein